MIDGTGNDQAKGAATDIRRPHPVRPAWHVIAAPAAALIVAATLLAGCSSARSELGTSASPCYLALPAASTAVHHRGHLLGVRLESAGWLRTHARHLYAADRAAHPSPPLVCLFAYSGHFRSDGVERPVGRPAGRLAVVEISYPKGRVIATLVVRHPPLTFGHSHIGLP